MQAIATQKASGSFVANLQNILNKPAKSLGTIILDESQRKDLDVICLGAELCHSSQFDDNHGIEIENATSLLSQEETACEADRSEWALLNGAVTLSLAAMVNTPKTFDTEMFLLACEILKSEEDRFLQGEIEMDQLPKIQDGKGHSILTKGVKMIRRVGAFFC